MGEKHRFTVSLGGYINYVMGPINDFSTDFQKDVLSYHGTGMVGIRLGKRKSKTAFGVFGSYGQYSPQASSRLSKFALPTTEITYRSVEAGFVFGNFMRFTAGRGWENLGVEAQPEEAYISTTEITYRSVEAGFVFGNFMRFTAGRGWENLGVKEQPEEAYISTTLGFAFGPRNFKLELNNNILFPDDRTRIIWRPSAGLSFKVNFL